VALQLIDGKNCLEQFNEKHCVVLYGSRFVVTHDEYDPTIRRTRTVFMRTEDFKKLYAHIAVRMGRGKEPIPAAEWWLAHKERRQAKGIVFDPSDSSEGYVNLWRDFSVKPEKKDCSRFLKLIKEVICDGDEKRYEFFVGYFAHMVQRPWELPETALILVGEQGTGKSFVIRQFSRLIAEHATMVSQRKHLVGGFNAHMARTLLLTADEVSIATIFATNAMKAPITEPTIMLEAKGHDAVAIRNCIRFVLITNDPHVVIMGSKERRFAVYDVNNLHQQDHKFFEEMTNYMNNGGLEGLMHHLMTFDLSQFNVRKVPRSKGFSRQVEQSFDHVTRFWYERLLEGEIKTGQGWPKDMAKDEITEEYLLSCSIAGVNRRSSETALFRRVRELCPDIKEYRPAGNKPRRFQFPVLQDARKAFDKYTGIDWSWDE